MPKTRKVLLSILAVLLVILAGRVFVFFNTVRETVVTDDTLAPEFIHLREQSWLQSAPLQLSDMVGNVVVLFLWTYD